MLTQVNASDKPKKPNKFEIALGLIDPAVQLGSLASKLPSQPSKLTNYINSQQSVSNPYGKRLSLVRR